MAITRRISQIISDSECFSLLSDGSQARKSGGEKELVFIRVIKNGEASYLCVALEDVDAFGCANAENLELSIKNAFLKKLKISESDFTKKIISATADGASVNFGQYNGLLTKLKEHGHEWLVNIHCVSHRIELAFKDALMKVKEFEEDNLSFMVSLSYLQKQSGKFKRELQETADAFDVTTYRFPKVHGTRFVSHQRIGLQKLMHNWIVLLIAVENMIANAGQSKVNPKIHGLKKKLSDPTFLWRSALYKQILDIFAEVSLKSERGELFAFEIDHAIQIADSRLEELHEAELSVAGLIKSAGAMQLCSESSSITVTLPKKGHIKRNPENREYQVLSYSSMKSDGGRSSTKLNTLKDQVLPSLRQCL